MNRRVLGSLCLLLILILVGGGFLLGWKWKRDAERLQRLDQQVADEVEQAVIAQLSSLPPDSPITQRYGEFQALEGTGFARHQGFKLGPSLSLDRRAQFAKAEVRCPIGVGYSDSLNVNFRMYPSPEWMAETPDASLVRSGSEFKMIRPGVEGSTSLEIAVGHPRFAYDARDQQRKQQQREDLDHLFSAFVAAVSSRDSERIDAALAAVDDNDGAELTHLFLRRGFASPDPAVRECVADWIGNRREGESVYLKPAIRQLFLEVIAKEDEPLDVRRPLVWLLLHDRGGDEKAVYEQLAEMGPAGHFAIPTLTAFVADQNVSHSRSGGAASAPIDAVELLGSWGPASAEAVPALIEALQVHPNAWDYRPAVATALGQIGPAANAAIPALLEATAQSRHKLRLAARTALDQIRTLPPAQTLRQVQLQTDGEALVPFQLDRRAQFTWLSSDGQKLEVVAKKETGEGLFQIELSSGIGRQLLAFDTANVVAAKATGEHLGLLRLINEAASNQVVFERWSLAERTRTEQRILTTLPPLKPKEKAKLANVVWNDALTRVAFNVKTRHPVPNKPGAVGISNDTFVYGLDDPHAVEISKLVHYMMEPIGFSADSQSLLLFGQYFDERWQWGIGTLDLSTEAFTGIADSDLSRVNRPRISPQAGYALYEPQGSRKPVVQLLSLASGKVTAVPLRSPADHITPPWRIAAAVSERHGKLVIATKTTLDLYDLASGERESRQSLLNAEGRQDVTPLLLEAGPAQVVYAGLTTKLPYETQTLWVKTMPIPSER